MKISKKIFSFLLCFVCLLCVLSASVVSADTVSKGLITVGTVKGNTGETVFVPIDISENPGIMSVTVSITYDSSKLEYKNYYKGNVFKDYTVADHPGKNIIRFVSANSQDISADGNLLVLEFKIKENAQTGLSAISIEYNNGDFCNWNLNSIMPKITSGGVEIAYNGKNCSHKNYGEWKVAVEPHCKEEGVKQKNCLSCGHSESEKIAPVGHEYSKEWTVNKVATKDSAGTMVRYCIRCTEYVDKITYSLEDAEDGEINNSIGTDVPKNDFTENLFEEQYPDKELTESKPETNDNKEMTIEDKLREAFPSYDTIIKIFNIMIIILLVVLI